MYNKDLKELKERVLRERFNELKRLARIAVTSEDKLMLRDEIYYTIGLIFGFNYCNIIDYKERDNLIRDIYDITDSVLYGVEKNDD